MIFNKHLKPFWSMDASMMFPVLFKRVSARGLRSMETSKLRMVGILLFEPFGKWTLARLRHE